MVKSNLQKYELDGRLIYVDDETKDVLEKTKNEEATSSPDLKNATIRISLMMECELLEKLREMAAQKSLPYQTLLKQILRERLYDNQIPNDEVQEIKSRLLALEKSIKKLKKAS